MDKTLQYPYNLLADILRDNGKAMSFSLPSDFTGSLEYVLHSLNNERATEIMALRYKEKLTLGEIGKRYEIGAERVRQIVSKSLRKIRHPKRMEYLIYGVAGKAKRDADEQEHRAVMAAVDAMKMERARAKALVEETYGVNLDKPINPAEVDIANMKFSVRLHNVLRQMGIRTLADILNYSASQFMGRRGFGIGCRDELAAALAERGYKLNL